MSQIADIVELGASSLKDGVPTWEGSVPVSDDSTDVEPFGPMEVMNALGVSARPWGKDKAGFAEGAVLRGVGGRNAVCVGGRDTRFVSIFGRLTEGDVAIHTVGPGEVAQLQLKQTKRQAAIVVKDEDGKTMAEIFDGKNKTYQLLVRGFCLQVDKDGEFMMVSKSGAGIKTQGGQVSFLGQLVIGFGPPGTAIMVGPQVGSPPGPAAAPLFPLMGVGVGTPG